MVQIVQSKFDKVHRQTARVLNHIRGAMDNSTKLLVSRLRKVASVKKRPLADTSRIAASQLRIKCSAGEDLQTTRIFAADRFTIDPAFVLAAAKQEKFRRFLEQAKQEAKDPPEKENNGEEALITDICERFAVKLGVKLLGQLPEDCRLSVEIDADSCLDVGASIDKARQILRLYAAHGVGKDCIQLKFPSSWECVQACKALEAQGVCCTFVGHSSSVIGSGAPFLSDQTGLACERLADGRVSAEVDMGLSSDVDACIAKAHEILCLFAAHGIEKSRVLLKLTSSWESVQACKALQNDGVNCTFLGHSQSFDQGWQGDWWHWQYSSQAPKTLRFIVKQMLLKQ